jgi:glycosyltransferase involved in cell wall biosynthesis
MFPPIPRHYFLQVPAVERVSGPITITWVGRLDRGKGADLVFEIMSRLEMQFSELNFDLLVHTVGDSLSVDVPAGIKSNPRYQISSVSYDGYTLELEAKVRDTLARGNIFICPYRELQSTIDCPMLIQEAAATGICVVTRDYPVSREILGSTGIYIGDVKDDDELIMSFTNATTRLIGELSVSHYNQTQVRSQELQNLFEASLISREFIEAVFEE